MSETKRRDFLKILGIGSAAGLGGACSKTAPDALVPYVTPQIGRASCRERV